MPPDASERRAVQPADLNGQTALDSDGVPTTAGREPVVALRKIRLEFRTREGPVLALDDVSLDVHEGEFVCLVGPSGCGKSTLLRIIAGLYQRTSGEMQVRTPPNRPATAMVFQEYALFPWRKVLDNVAFGLENRGVPKRERHEIALRHLARVGLREFAGAYPHQLSGGMRQRVGIARALATDPEILLMDEPFSALDAQTRYILQEELLRIWEETRKTVIYVTHSIDEAILLGDRIVLFTARPGRIKSTCQVPLPRPRDLDMRADPRAIDLQTEIWHALKVEVQRTMEQQAGAGAH